MIRKFDTDTGDLATSGEQFLEEQASTGAGIRHRLLMFFGEYFLDITDGSPWFQAILGKSPQGQAELALKQRIITAPDVVALKEFNFDSDRSSRKITVTATVLDVNSESISFVLDEDVI